MYCAPSGISELRASATRDPRSGPLLSLIVLDVLLVLGVLLLLGRRREPLVHPSLPQRLLPGGDIRRLVAVQIQVDYYEDLAAHGVGVERADARRRLVEPEEKGVLAAPFDAPGERRHAVGRASPQAHRGAPEAQRLDQRLPRLRLRVGGRGQEPQVRSPLAPVVSEIQHEDAEEPRPSGFDTLKLTVPFVAAREQAVHYTDDAGVAGALLHGPLRGEGRSLLSPVTALGREPVLRLPGGDGRPRVQALTEMRDDGAAHVLLDLGRHEPA